MRTLRDIYYVSARKVMLFLWVVSAGLYAQEFKKTYVNAKEEDVKLVGLSALMTTTLKSMEDTIAALRASGHNCRIMVGGAVLTPDYAEKIGADFYARDAKESADIAKEVLG